MQSLLSLQFCRLPEQPLANRPHLRGEHRQRRRGSLLPVMVERMPHGLELPSHVSALLDELPALALVHDHSPIAPTGGDAHDCAAITRPTDLGPSAPQPAPAEDPVLQALGHDPATLDALVARTGLDTPALLARLLDLELQGALARMPGGLYQRTASP